MKEDNQRLLKILVNLEFLKDAVEVLKKLKENDMLNNVVKLSEDEGFLVHFDVGHVKPSFTMINGMKARVISNSEEGKLIYLK